MVCSGCESPLFNIVPGRLTDLAIGSRVRQSVSATNERTRIPYYEPLLDRLIDGTGYETF